MGSATVSVYQVVMYLLQLTVIYVSLDFVDRNPIVHTLPQWLSFYVFLTYLFNYDNTSMCFYVFLTYLFNYDNTYEMWTSSVQYYNSYPLSDPVLIAASGFLYTNSQKLPTLYLLQFEALVDFCRQTSKNLLYPEALLDLCFNFSLFIIKIYIS